MYNIYKISQDLYQLHSTISGVKAMEGTLVAISVYLIHTLGFDAGEVEAAFVDMLYTEYDSAHFGLYKTFIYSFDRKKAS